MEWFPVTLVCARDFNWPSTEPILPGSLSEWNDGCVSIISRSLVFAPTIMKLMCSSCGSRNYAQTLETKMHITALLGKATYNTKLHISWHSRHWTTLCQLTMQVALGADDDWDGMKCYWKFNCNPLQRVTLAQPIQGLKEKKNESKIRDLQTYKLRMNSNDFLELAHPILIKTNQLEAFDSLEIPLSPSTNCTLNPLNSSMRHLFFHPSDNDQNYTFPSTFCRNKR